MNILITGSRAPVAVLLARTLHGAGHTVYTADSIHPTLGRYSEAVTRDLPLPAPRKDIAHYGETVARYASRFGIEWLIPTCEEIFHLARPECRGPIEATGTRLFVPPLDTLSRLHSKHEFARQASLLGLPVPETRRIATPADWGNLDYSRDAVLKREFSRFGGGVVPLRGDWGQRRQDAMSAIEQEGASGWVWQDWVRGRAVCSYSLCVNGTIQAHVTYIIPYRMGTERRESNAAPQRAPSPRSLPGVGVYYEPYPLPEMYEAAKRLAAENGFTGQLGLDGIIDAETDQLYLIECNPRATMGIALLADHDDFKSAWRQALGEETPDMGRQATETRQAIQSRLATLLFGWKYRDPDRTLGRWLSDVFTAPDALASAEPRFWWAQPYVLASFSRQAQERALSLTAFTTHDIEWNGEGENTGISDFEMPRDEVKWTPLFPDAPAPEKPEAAPLPDTFGESLFSVRRPSLFKAFPDLEEHFSWSPLLTPQASPVQQITVPDLHAPLWIKRDDLNDRRYGGNKARKFEWILGDLLKQERKELMTFGGLCSNHCLAAAIYGHAAGVGVRLFYTATLLDQEERDLLYLQAFLGAEQQMVAPDTIIGMLGESTRPHGPYVVPPGGSSGVGILGYVDAGLELADQIRRGEMPNPDLIYIASASRGTVLGLSIGLNLSGLTPVPRLVPVEAVSPFWQNTRWTLAGAHYQTYERLRHLLPEARALLPEFDELVPGGYTRFGHLEPGETNEELNAALELGKTIEGLHLDRHFSGKAFAAFLADSRAGGLHGKTVLFWQTHGRTPKDRLREAQRLSTAGSLFLPPDVADAVNRASGVRSRGSGEDAEE